MNRLHAFLFKKEESHTLFLAFFRVCVGVFCLIHFLSVYKDFELLYGAHGLVPTEVSELFKNPLIPSFSQAAHAAMSTLGWSYASASFFFQLLYVVACLALAIGFCSRSSAILLLVLHLMLAKGTYFYAYGVDYFTTIALFYCCLFPVGGQHAADGFFFTKKKHNPTPYRRVLQVHLCFVYFFSGLDKLAGYNWHNGEAIWKALHLPYFNTDFAFDVNPLATYPFLFVLAGWATICIELLYPVFISFKKTRGVWLCLTVMLHIGILLHLGLYFFSTLMILLNLAAFMDLTRSSQSVSQHTWMRRFTSLQLLRKTA